jgi:rhodanese-related sulfurtransferase
LFPPPVPSVDPAGISADTRFLDVRELEDWQAGHIDGAVHIPLADLPARVGELSLDDEIVVICRSGGRSGRAVSWLNGNGFDVLNFDGGMVAWAASGQKMVSETGEAPAVR